jgi:hypothetical protein
MAAARPSVTRSTTATTENNMALNIYSLNNPPNNDLQIMVKGGSKEKINLSAVSMDGKLLYSVNGNTNQAYTFGNSFANGLYIIKVTQGKTVKTLEVVKEN